MDDELIMCGCCEGCECELDDACDCEGGVCSAYDGDADDMDGDHDSAMESVGWGTDEDYGYYGGDE